MHKLIFEKLRLVDGKMWILNGRFALFSIFFFVLLGANWYFRKSIVVFFFFFWVKSPVVLWVFGINFFPPCFPAVKV